MGNNTLYTPEIMVEICERIASGETLTQMCKEEHLPSVSTVHSWVLADKIPGLAGDIAQARERGYDAIAEQSLLVAQGVENYSSGDINRDKLIVDTRLKLLAKWSKRYADKQQIELTGKDGAPLSMRLIEAQQRLLKDVTPLTLNHQPTALEDII